MKAEGHPQYHEASVSCASCGSQFVVGSVSPELHIGVCWNCHPFYTGKARVVDSEGRVDQFQRKFGKFLEKKKAAKTASENA